MSFDISQYLMSKLISIGPFTVDCGSTDALNDDQWSLDCKRDKDIVFYELQLGFSKALRLLQCRRLQVRDKEMIGYLRK